MTHKIAPINLSKIEIGKSPYWNPRTNSLYYVNLYRPALVRYDLDSKTIYNSEILNEDVVSFVIPIQHVPRFFLVGLKRKLCIIEWDGITETCEVVRMLFEVESDQIYEYTRFNIGKIDPIGRFYGSTMCSELCVSECRKKIGKLYKYENGQNQIPKMILENIGHPNGFIWNPSINIFYYIESFLYYLKEYDYDPQTGNLSNEKILSDFREKRFKTNPVFIPNDITIDSNGFLYICGIGNPNIFKINPSTGAIEMSILMPTNTITGLTFGGPDLNILYVTSASKPYMDIVPPLDRVLAGSLFQVTCLDSIGIEMKNMQLKLCLCSKNKNC